MVVSLDPNYASFKTTPGRRHSDFDIGQMAVAALARSVERYKGQFAVHRTVSAVEELLRAAKIRARREGKTVSHVLREHQDALEHQDASSKFIVQTGDYGGANESGHNVSGAMVLQDERRAEHTFSSVTAAAARAVDSAESARMLVPYVEREELYVPEPSTSVMRLPALAHRLGGDTPNADHLRLMAPPPTARESSDPSRASPGTAPRRMGSCASPQ